MASYVVTILLNLSFAYAVDKRIKVSKVLDFLLIPYCDRESSLSLAVLFIL